MPDASRIEPDGVERRVLSSLEELGATYEVIEIDPALADTEAFCERYGYAPDDSANCIVVASRDDEPVRAACLNLATTKLDVNKRVRRLLGVRKLSFAAADDTRAVTGMEIGGVTPFGLPAELPLYVDAAVLDRDRVIVGGGSRRLKVLVDPEVFRRMVSSEVVDGLANRL